jgi:hypothetical protein
MAIELRRCESVDVPGLLAQLGAWHRVVRAPYADDAARDALLTLTRDPALGSIWLISHRGRQIGYTVIQNLAARGFLWQEADLVALYLVPEERANGIGRIVRRTLRELLMGQGFAMIPTAVLEDRCWAALGTSDDGTTLFEAA